MTDRRTIARTLIRLCAVGLAVTGVTGTAVAQPVVEGRWISEGDQRRAVIAFQHEPETNAFHLFGECTPRQLKVHVMLPSTNFSAAQRLIGKSTPITFEMGALRIIHRGAVREEPSAGLIVADLRLTRDDPLFTALGRGGSVKVIGPVGAYVLPLTGAGAALDGWLAKCGGGAARPAAVSASDNPPAGVLSAAEVRAQLIGRRLRHLLPNRQTVPFFFSPDGTLESANWNESMGISGRYRIEADGRLCWSMIAEGCFQYYRRDGTLRVRRADRESRIEIGTVRFE